MAVNGTSGTSGTGSTSNVVSPDQQGFAALDSNTFLKLLITQLQNQDPLNPTSNEDLVNQLSAMRSLQANLEMTNALKSITSNQQLSTAATFIGKTVTGTAGDQTSITGVVDRAFTRDGEAYLAIGDKELSLTNVESVSKA